MRAPDTKKPGKRRLPSSGLRTTSGALNIPEVVQMGSPRVLLSGSLSAASQHQLDEALNKLKPPSAKRESWRKNIHQALAFREMHWNDHVEFDKPRPSRGRPPDTRTRDAGRLAQSVLEMCGLKLATGPKGKWHLLTQIFADSSSDLRHHLHALLAEKS